MHIVANGDRREAEEGTTLEELLRDLGLDTRSVVVERNGQVVPRDTYGEVALADADRLEIVRFVGGG